MTTPSQVPVRYPSGVSTDFPWGPLANYGQPNPFMYQTMFDDFLGAVTLDEDVNTVTSGTGAAVASTAGDGGLVLLTTSTAGAGVAGFKGPANNFYLPPSAYSGTGLTATLFPSKKVFFATRINVTAVASTTIVAGLVPQATTTATPTDGIFFSITSATAGVLTAYSASVQQWSVALPLSSLNPAYANAQWLDLAFYMDRLQNVYAFAGFPLFGFVPPSAWSGVNNVNAAPPPLGAVASYLSFYNGAIQNTWTPTTAGLTYFVSAAGTVQTAYVDFLLAAKER